jgi:1,4-alpha-glucan branching enzyme
MSLKKQYLKSRPVCKVTFRMPAAAAPEAQKMEILGEFSNWQPLEMDQLKDGSFKKVLELEAGHAYQYRYRIDDTLWANDWEADDYVPNGLTAEDNSVVMV